MNSLQGALREIFSKFVHRNGIYIFILDVICCIILIPSTSIDKYDYNEPTSAGYFNVIVGGRQMHSS